MFAGVSGLRSHQVMMDVVGNNIANVNTIGFKSSNAIFSDLLSQTLRGAGSPDGGLSGGTNPAQVGLGVRLAAITMNFSQGASQLTGRSTDFAIQGDGTFIVDVAGTRAYTRAGSFNLDALGQLVTQEGGLVQGWNGVNGVVDTNQSIGPLRIPVGQTIAPVTTTSIGLGGNLPADSATGTIINASINAYNTLGTAVPMRIQYTKVADGAATVNWQVDVYDPDGNQISGPYSLQFDQATSEISAPASRQITIPTADLNTIQMGGATPAGDWDPAGLVLDFGTATAPDRMTGAAVTNSAAALNQNGSPLGSLVSFSVSQEGLISGVFSNGKNMQLGQIALAAFTNPSGLEKAGGSLYRSTVNSGEPLIGVAGSGGRGTMTGGTVEMSNVDLAAEFTNLIVAQRGFQANSRIITASDEILQDLVNLKR
jgi:flagellar hook protein FlgE